ncbi:hypothetical protein [Arthrobacter sp. SX1312]|uniref:hypothetical protein n=1 Tax=Arthrobacter sp. SX1312 TaxID=2058896 RepID=UPI000CE315B2|nr:hypothetical protein [Arthrobacter sp. SX1312]
MSRSGSILAGFIALGVAVAVLTGCNTSTPGTSTPSTSIPSTSASSRAPENVSEVCTAASDFAAALTAFKQTLTPGVTVEQLDAARDEVVTTYDDLIEASQDVAEDQVGAVRTAKDELVRAVEAVPDDATLSQAIASLRDEAADVQATVSDLQAEATC